MNEFEKIYREAIINRNKIHDKRGYDSIQPAFTREGKFDRNNWNDPLMSIFRNELYFEALENGSNYKVYGKLFYEQDQTTLVLQNEHIIYALTWYKNRGKTEEFFQLSEPHRVVTLEEVYEFLVDCDVDAEKYLTKLEE